eukprot:CAMPEP_0201573348 /NCGR_PEP_ID=MMETSP0190_2-20130828/17143_1 /ASSEMBLY_ACC=CAM_ASM_000263 /TAXON_ID=37353 /ORGANISM="Rosalina sp." /LENGTH=383 /DNA_ID=CAMNT_0048000211 /DNA_START=909 /DNA_END=2057 /DNA_ORIENTATION=+
MKEEQRKQRQIEIEQHQKLLEEKDDNDSEAEEIFECVVCNKIFKSQNAFNTHESSKKHIKALENLKFQLELENDLIFNNDKDEMKTNEQSNVDAMIAKQLAHRQKVDNDDTNTTTTTTDNDEEEEESEPQTKKKADDGPIDLDYLIALTMEQEDIMETMDLFDDDINDKDNKSQNRSALITDSEIIALLESGIDIESLTNTYPELTKEYIIALKQRTKARQNGNNKDKKKRKNKRKNKRKKRSSSYNQDEQIIQNNDDNDGIEEQQNDENDDGDDEEEQLDAFMNQFKSFKKKSDFINRQKNKQRSVSHNDADNDNDNNNSTKKKRRRRRNKNKDTHSQRNIVSSSTTSPIKSKCKACETTFSSKNKLYDHLKQFPKHALKSQ